MIRTNSVLAAVSSLAQPWPIRVVQFDEAVNAHTFDRFLREKALKRRAISVDNVERGIGRILCRAAINHDNHAYARS